MSFDMKQLRAFEAVARHGSFTRASAEVGLTQPTLSTHIRNLETVLDTRLFDRASRKVSLTPTGHLLADYARRILDLYNESVEAIEAFAGDVRGSIRVEASTVPGEYILPKRLVDFHRRYPEIQIILSVSDSAAVISRVEKGEASIGIAGRPADNPSLASDQLCRDTITMVTAPGSALAQRNSLVPGQLTGLPLIRREPGSATQLASEGALKSHGIEPDTMNWTASLGSTRAVVEGVIAGLGSAFVSRNTVSREIADGTLVEIIVNGFNISRGIYVISHRQHTLSPAASCFLEDLLRSGPESGET